MDKRVDYGLTGFIKNKKIERTSNIGRIIMQTNHTYTVVTQAGIFEHVKQIRTKKEKKRDINSPYVVGDYVEIIKKEEHYFLAKVFDRKNILSKSESKAKKSFRRQTVEQLMASNIDHVFITISSDQRFTLSKLERYILTFTIPNATIDIIITKSDHEEQTKFLESSIKASELNLNVYKTSIYNTNSFNPIKKRITSNSTAVLLGASGTGKSTLINMLADEYQEKTGAVRSDGKGKHTTTYTTIVPILNSTAYIIDTPGIKSISTSRETEEIIFKEILELSKKCNFRDCQHRTEPACAVKEAVRTGLLSVQKVERFHKSL